MSFIFNFCFIPLCNLATLLFLCYHAFSLHKCEVIHNYEIVDNSGICFVTCNREITLFAFPILEFKKNNKNAVMQTQK
jgi:hypothetical protein